MKGGASKYILALVRAMLHTSPREECQVQPEKTPRERATKFIRDLVSDWRPSRDQVLWATRIGLGLVVLLGILTLIGLPFEITLWNWLDLLIVPVVLAIGGYLFTRSETQATQAAAERRAQDDTLQAYLDGMSQLLTDKERPLYRAQMGDSLSTVARAKTLTVLPRLAGNRKARVVQFLHESGLIAGLIPKNPPIVVMSGADLREADLIGANLEGDNLLGATLIEANLIEAKLRGANLMGANLMGADLSGAFLEEAILVLAVLNGADLREAYLMGADLSGVREWTEVQLSTAMSLKRATMPTGQRYEDWIKSKGSEEGGDNQ
jgi:hypothetical protein